jgi:hypothetical protein
VRQTAPVKLPEPIPDGLAELLITAFKPAEFVSIGPGVFTDGRVQCPTGKTFKVDWLLGYLSKKSINEMFPHSICPDGLFIRVNPMRQDTGSDSDSDKDVSVFRHTLLEFDSGEKGVQYGSLLESGLPLTAIIDSGGASIHGWVRVDAPDAKEYKRRVALIYRFMAKYGVDPGNKNASRYSRCPGITRNVYC